MSKYTVCRQEWRHFPKVLVMRNVETGEERRYVPESEDAATGEDVANALLSGYSLGLNVSSDNAKLCELLRDLWQFTGAACKKYPRLFDQPAQGGQSVQPNAIDFFEQRMRELGVVK